MDLGLRFTSAMGFIAMMAIAWTVSRDRKRIAWQTVRWGVALQLAIALPLLLTDIGPHFFSIADRLFSFLADSTDQGVGFVFGKLNEPSILTRALPIILVMGSIFSVLYHLGIAQRIINGLAYVLSRTMRLSGAESLASVSNVFLGMTESALVVKPFVARMTRSELFTLMTVGMGTVAGSVLVAYRGFIGEGYAGHLVAASLISAPAGILIAKIMEPETQTPESLGVTPASVEVESVNVIDAAALGAISGLRLAAYVGAMLLVFVALTALVNGILGGVGGWFGYPQLTLQLVLGYLLAPLAMLMGVAPSEATTVGSLLGVKTILNEFLAYQQLGEATLSDRSTIIATYALCGFANFGSLAILLGGLGGIAPERRSDIAQLGMRSILSGSLTTFMTACLAGVLA